MIQALDDLLKKYNQVNFQQLRMRANYKSPQHYPDKEWTMLLEEKIKLEMEIVGILKGGKPEGGNDVESK